MIGALIFPLLLFLVLLGPAIGSFFTAYVYRELYNDKKYGKRSVCDHCGKTLGPSELVPIFSYLIQKGKCSKCKKKIPPEFFIVEVLGLVVFSVLAAGIYYLYLDGQSIEIILTTLIVQFVLTCLFYLPAIHDLLSYSIPTNITYLLTGLSILLNCIAVILSYLGSPFLTSLSLGGIDNLLMAVILGGFVYLLVKVTKEKGMGSGDVLLAIFIGAMLGWPSTVGAGYVLILSAALVGLLFAYKKKKFKGLIIPLVPFMLLGYIVGVFFGTDIYRLLFFIL
jgi:leader peptidase (prepilin peptidase)/N-methyltransferase